MKKLIFLCLLLCFTIIGLPLAIISTFDDQPIVEEKLESKERVKVFINKTNETVEIGLEEYLKSVVASEMPGEFEEEALKAQAVAARTYAMSRMKIFSENGHPDHSQAPLCDGVHCQVYIPYEKLKEIKSSDWVLKYWGKISEAVEETQGQVMTYEGELVDQPLFHSTSGGNTENSEDVFITSVPYLRSVESPFEQEAPYYKDSVTIGSNEFKSQILAKYKNLSIDLSHIEDSVQILERSSGGRVSKIKVGNLVLSGRDVREMLGLRSANFTIESRNNQITFNTIGYGHGVGMSQWGANGMAEQGIDYIEILQHYYQGVEIHTINQLK